MAGQVNWYGNRVKATLKNATDEIMAKAAFHLEAMTKANIVANDQVDTGFLLNSVYAVTDQGSTYGAAKSAASAKNPAAEMGPEPHLEDGQGAAVGVGASYAVYQEIQQSFLYRALEALTNVAAFGAIVDEATSGQDLKE